MQKLASGGMLSEPTGDTLVVHIRTHVPMGEINLRWYHNTIVLDLSSVCFAAGWNITCACAHRRGSVCRTRDRAHIARAHGSVALGCASYDHRLVVGCYIKPSSSTAMVADDDRFAMLRRERTLPEFP